MHPFRKSGVLSVAALALVAGGLLVSSQAGATMLQRMELGDLVHNAGRIFRGTVIDVEQGSVAVGGGELPMIVYRLRVDQMVKGEADVVKDDEAYVEIKMVGSLKEPVSDGDLRHLSAFRDVPRLQMGADYLLFTTPTSAIGLSTTVGLGQGAFTVFTQGKTDFAVNQFGNDGLGLDGAGAVPYEDLLTRVKGLMGQ